MKRSAQVALLLMGVGGVGAGAYAMAPPRNNCVPQGGTPPSAVAPNPAGAPAAAAQPCPPRRSGTSGGYSGRSYYGSHWSTPIFNRSSTASSSTVPSAGRSGTTGPSSGGGTARGGFGGTGHAASAGG